MALYIKNAEADRLARDLVQKTGESLTDAIVHALRERIERLDDGRAGRAERLRAIARDCASLIDGRTLDTADSYDAHGPPA